MQKYQVSLIILIFIIINDIRKRDNLYFLTWNKTKRKKYRKTNGQVSKCKDQFVKENIYHLCSISLKK